MGGRTITKLKNEINLSVDISEYIDTPNMSGIFDLRKKEKKLGLIKNVNKLQLASDEGFIEEPEEPGNNINQINNIEEGSLYHDENNNESYDDCFEYEQNSPIPI